MKVFFLTRMFMQFVGCDTIMRFALRIQAVRRLLHSVHQERKLYWLSKATFGSNCDNDSNYDNGSNGDSDSNSTKGQ